MDRLVRSRLWIAIIAASLLGVVAAQVSLLQLNTGVGRAVEAAATLERQNAAVRMELSYLTESRRIERAAATLGMVRPTSEQVRYRQSGEPAADARRAVRTMTPPAPPESFAPVGLPFAPAAAPAVPTPAPPVTPTVAAPQTTAPSVPATPATQVVVSPTDGLGPAGSPSP